MSKNSESQTLYESETREDWLDRAARFNQHFGRFARDALGVVLLALALMIFLALAGLPLDMADMPSCVITRLPCRGAVSLPWSSQHS
jgi:hypothetical protein